MAFVNYLELNLDTRSSNKKRIIYLDKYFFKSIRRRRKDIELVYGVKIKKRK